jgi:hypothetical protein
MEREHHYKTTTDTGLTMEQKREIIAGLFRGIDSIKSRMTTYQEFDLPINLSEGSFYFKRVDQNEKLVSVFASLMGGYYKPKRLYGGIRINEIGQKSLLISSKTGASVNEVFDKFCDWMMPFLKP